MTETIAGRVDFVLLFDVKDGNPNGDPDAGNQPRVDPETMQGLVTDVCIKRKVRNYVSLARPDAPGFDIYVKEKAVLNQFHECAYTALELKYEKKKLPKDAEKARQITAWMCQNFFDIRTFGAVMTTEVNAGQVRGPVQLTFARSVDPIVSAEHSITRMAVTNESDRDKERTMGCKYTVPYALYRAHGFVSAPLAAQTGFGPKDLELFWDALLGMFEHDHSAARGEMITRKLVVFLHDNRLGNAPAHTLFERVKIDRVGGDLPARSFNDYKVEVREGGLPQGVQIQQMR